MPGGAFREDSGVSGSDGADLVRLRTLGALRDLELDPLGLVEAAVTLRVDRGVVAVSYTHLTLPTSDLV